MMHGQKCTVKNKNLSDREPARATRGPTKPDSHWILQWLSTFNPNRAAPLQKTFTIRRDRERGKFLHPGQVVMIVDYGRVRGELTGNSHISSLPRWGDFKSTAFG